MGAGLGGGVDLKKEEANFVDGRERKVENPVSWEGSPGGRG